VPVADDLVGDSIWYASTFECGRVSKVYGLYRCPFSCPQGLFLTAPGEVSFRIDLSGRASLCQTASRSVCSQRSPAS
jgi:hypothetical protein